MNEVPSVEEYVEAFVALEDGLPESYWKILEVHYAAPDLDITATQLSHAMEYANFNSSNLHYGKLGRLVGKQLGLPPNDRLRTLVTFENRENEWHWIMRPEVAEALEKLGWVGSEEAVIVANSVESAFKKFRANFELHFVAKLRMLRTQQIRHLMSNPDEITLDTFNREVWQHDTGRYLIRRSGERINLYDAEVEERELALQEERIDLHGNQIWGNAARVFGSMLKISDKEKTDLIRSALHTLNNTSIDSLEAMTEVISIPGFGESIASGLTMLFHPRDFAVYNLKSKGAIEKLGYGNPSVEGFQVIVSDLRECVQAEDFIELDWFLCLIYEGEIVVLKNGEEPSENHNPAMQLNTILFGPPGTGKTYSVQRRAVKIIEDLPEEISEAGISEKFREYRDEGRIEFVTFHPSFSYEEFVEGFRYDEAKMIPTRHDGVFKKICERALEPRQRKEVWKEARIWKVSLDKFDRRDIFERCMDKGEIAIQSNEGKPFDYLTNKMSPGDYVVVWGGLTDISAIGIIDGEYHYVEEYESNYPHVRNVTWLDRDDHSIREMNHGKALRGLVIYPLNRIAFQDFVALLPEEEKREEPYVLIIDEINRGNISRIFGELITLLEPDKRRGAKNELSTRLPYSGENFSVPRNLHIIGTMNTADRSIALLDVALRRRFEFEEMMPRVDVVRKVLSEDAETVTDVGLICDVFEVLNARITALLDRDHAIGHSYFLSATSPERLRHALYRRVFPLLQEYFYNDVQRLTRLLGKFDGETGFIERPTMNFGKSFASDASIDDALWSFHEYEADELEDVLRRTFLEG